MFIHGINAIIFSFFFFFFLFQALVIGLVFTFALCRIPPRTSFFTLLFFHVEAKASTQSRGGDGATVTSLRTQTPN